MEKRRVMIVEDSTSARRSLERTLAAYPLEVIALGSGADALERLPLERPDLVICDIALPDTSGYDICRFIRRDPRLNSIPVVLTSPTVNSVVLQRAAEVGATDVLFKPVVEEDVARKVIGILTGAGTNRPARDFKPSLVSLLTIPGVRSIVLADREGFLIEAAGTEPGGETTGAVAACLAQSCRDIGTELGQGPLDSTILEYQSSMLILQSVASEAILAILVDDPSALGSVREAAKAVLPPLADALAA